MGRKKPHYQHFSDYPLFKLVGLLMTIATFMLGYWYIEYVYNIGICSLVGLTVPCAIVLLWGFIKQRNLWISWIVFAMFCVVALSFVEEENLFTDVIGHAYWVTALVTSFVSIMSCSRAERHAREMMSRDVKLTNTVDPVKDAFLEELFKGK